MKETWSIFLSILLILFFGFTEVGTLFRPGFYTGRDGEHQLVWQYVFGQGLRDEQNNTLNSYVGTSNSGNEHRLVWDNKNITKEYT